MLTRLVVRCAVVAVLVISAGPAFAQSEPPKESDILKLMDATGAAKMGEQMVGMVLRQMNEMLRQTAPDVPPRAFEIGAEVLQQKFGEAMKAPNGLLPRIAALYAQHFTRDDILGLLAFFESDLGKKLIGEQPALMRESIEIGQSWTASILPEAQAEIMKRLKAEGLIK